MILLRLLGPQGIAGLAISIALALLLVVQKGETRHWKKQSARFEQRFVAEQSAFAQTVANYRAAADAARADDRSNLARVEAAQRSISERTRDDYQARLAAARALAQRLHGETAPADSGAGRGSPVPGVSAAAGRIAQGPGHDRLPGADALLATEQAIQLDELIKWVVRQHAVDPNGRPSSAKETGD